MKEYMGSTANLFLLETTDNKLRAQAELVILVSEPKYHPDAGGGFAKVRETVELRFSAGIKGLRKMVEALTVIADEAERFEERASLEPDQEGGAA